MSVPVVVDYLDGQWGSHRADEYNTGPGRPWRTWLWLPKVIDHGGVHSLALGRRPSSDRIWEVQVAGGECCPMDSTKNYYRSEPTDIQIGQVAGMAFGLYDEVITHHLDQVVKRVADQVEREVHREARYQQELSRGSRMLPGYMGRATHSYTRDRMLEVEGAIRAMTNPLTREQVREKMEMVVMDFGPIIPVQAPQVEEQQT